MIFFQFVTYKLNSIAVCVVVVFLYVCVFIEGKIVAQITKNMGFVTLYVSGTKSK